MMWTKKRSKFGAIKTNGYDSKKESKVETEKVVSKVKETKHEPIANNVDNSGPELDWDENIPF